MKHQISMAWRDRRGKDLEIFISYSIARFKSLNIVRVKITPKIKCTIKQSNHKTSRKSYAVELYGKQCLNELISIV